LSIVFNIFRNERKKRSAFAERFYENLELVGNVRKQCYLSCALDSGVQLTLMLCAGSGNSSGKYFSTFTDELSELCGILVVDKINLVSAENANFLSSADNGTLRAYCCVFSSIHF
jgi:hypothetical protein